MSQELDTIAAAAANIAADLESGVVIDTRRLESADDAFAEIRKVGDTVVREFERVTDRAIVANRTIGRTLIWIYDQVCDFASVPLNKRTPREALTIGKIGPVIGLSKLNSVELTGIAFDSLTAAIELGRADDHYHREARLLLDDRGESVNVKSLRRACNELMNPTVVSNRKVGAAKAHAAAIAAVTGKAAKTITATGADAKVVAKVTARVATSLLTPAAIAAASDEQITATIWALSQVRDARKAGTMSQTKAPRARKAPAKA